MSPKEKAEELYYLFLYPARKYSVRKPFFSEREQSKQSSIICVQKILEEFGTYYITQPINEIGKHQELKQVSYWHQVIKEIEKL